MSYYVIEIEDLELGSKQENLRFSLSLVAVQFLLERDLRVFSELGCLNQRISLQNEANERKDGWIIRPS